MKLKAFFRGWFRKTQKVENPFLGLRHLEAGQKKCQLDFQLTCTETMIENNFRTFSS